MVKKKKTWRSAIPGSEKEGGGWGRNLAELTEVEGKWRYQGWDNFGSQL